MFTRGDKIEVHPCGSGFDDLCDRLTSGAPTNSKAVQSMLGHASAAMTLDIYAGLFRDDVDPPQSWSTQLLLWLVRTHCGLGRICGSRRELN